MTDLLAAMYPLAPNSRSQCACSSVRIVLVIVARFCVRAACTACCMRAVYLLRQCSGDAALTSAEKRSIETYHELDGGGSGSSGGGGGSCTESAASASAVAAGVAQTKTRAALTATK